MSNIIEISEFLSPALDVFARLTEAQLRGKSEPEKGIFIAESAKVIALALDAGCEPISLLVEKKQIARQAQEILNRCGDIPVYTAPSELLAQLTGFQLSQGVLCAMRRPPLPSVEQLCASAGRVAVLEGIMDSTNIGAIFRSAAALNIDAVLVTPTCCDPLLRRAVRVSMGTIFQVPWTRIGGESSAWGKQGVRQAHNGGNTDTGPQSEWPQPGLERLGQLGFKTVAMALCSTAVGIDDPQLMAEERLAIVLGTEGSGLAPSTIAACDYTACIPMSHNVDSLNVAAAAAVAFWQLRVRR